MTRLIRLRGFAKETQESKAHLTARILWDPSARRETASCKVGHWAMWNRAIPSRSGQQVLTEWCKPQTTMAVAALRKSWLPGNVRASSAAAKPKPTCCAPIFCAELGFAPLQLISQNFKIGFILWMNQFQSLHCTRNPNAISCLQRYASLPIQCKENRIRILGHA